MAWPAMMEMLKCEKACFKYKRWKGRNVCCKYESMKYEPGVNIIDIINIIPIIQFKLRLYTLYFNTYIVYVW